ncbi:MAG: NAD(P) transhydrogenase subunit alpha [Colwellia sp.]
MLNKIAVIKEIAFSEKRVALTPPNVEKLVKAGLAVMVQSNAGNAASFSDEQYQKAGAIIKTDAAFIVNWADVVLQVNSASLEMPDAVKLKPKQWLIGMMDPLSKPQLIRSLAKQDITAIAMEMIPRISRAQSMDTLSSMATIAGYKSVLLGASAMDKIFPMLMTAAGNLRPARVLIMGVGVAGLQAAATAKRMGGVVEAYDVRPAAREQILSVGAKPIELELDTTQAEGANGYAKEQGDEFLKKQREQMTKVVAEQDLIITTAAIPGGKSPILVTEHMVKQMKSGAVIVDLAAERGGNCDLTQLGKTIIAHDVTIIGPDNIVSSVATHASQLYGKNLEHFLLHLYQKEQGLTLDLTDEIIEQTLLTHHKEILNERVKSLIEVSILTEQKLSIESSKQERS